MLFIKRFTLFLGIVLLHTTCQKELHWPVEPVVIPPAIFSIDCNNIRLLGGYTKDYAMDLSNKLEIPVTVTSPGSYSFNTGNINGVRFCGNGNLVAGSQNILLVANGTPEASGVFSYPIIPGCDIDVSYANAVNIQSRFRFKIGNEVFNGPLEKGKWFDYPTHFLLFKGTTSNYEIRIEFHYPNGRVGAGHYSHLQTEPKYITFWHNQQHPTYRLISTMGSQTPFSGNINTFDENTRLVEATFQGEVRIVSPSNPVPTIVTLTEGTMTGKLP